MGGGVRVGRNAGGALVFGTVGYGGRNGVRGWKRLAAARVLALASASGTVVL